MESIKAARDPPFFQAFAKQVCLTLCFFPFREVQVTCSKSRGKILLSTSFLSGTNFEKELMFYHFAEEMSHEDMGLLNAGRAIGGYGQGEVGDLRKNTPIISR